MQKNRDGEKDGRDLSLQIEGRNAVLEAFRSGRTIDKLFVQKGCQDGPVQTIVREAKKRDTILEFVDKERLSRLSVTGGSSLSWRPTSTPRWRKCSRWQRSAKNRRS